jgi:hypothetical protein
LKNETKRKKFEKRNETNKINPKNIIFLNLDVMHTDWSERIGKTADRMIELTTNSQGTLVPALPQSSHFF